VHEAVAGDGEENPGDKEYWTSAATPKLLKCDLLLIDVVTTDWNQRQRQK
jgi:hypothetical protein